MVIDEGAIWFVEYRSTSGWRPAIHHGGPPKQVGPEGRRVEFREEPRPIPDYLEGMPLGHVAMFMAEGGSFRKYDLKTQIEIAAFLRSPTKSVMVIQERER